MATLEAALAEAMALVADVSGIRQAPALPTDSMGVFPFALGYPRAGVASFGVAGERLNLDSIVIEVHVNRADLATSTGQVIPFVDSVPAALMDGMVTDQWNSTIETFATVDWEFGDLGWGDIKTIGFRFTVTGIKRRNNI